MLYWEMLVSIPEQNKPTAERIGQRRDQDFLVHFHFQRIKKRVSSFNEMRRRIMPDQPRVWGKECDDQRNIASWHVIVSWEGVGNQEFGCLSCQFINRHFISNMEHSWHLFCVMFLTRLSSNSTFPLKCSLYYRISIF